MAIDRLQITGVPIVDLEKTEIAMTEDPRCCGTGTCIINEDGMCWCGQKWNGEEMCFPTPGPTQHDPAQSANDVKLNPGQTTDV